MKQDWWSCDGRGDSSCATVSAGGMEFPASTMVKSAFADSELRTQNLRFSRRCLLMGGALAAVGWTSREVSALADLAVKPNKHTGDILVTIFLRGGADGLNIVPPYAEDEYHKARPTLRVASPKESSAPAANRAIDLDGFFGLHPALAPLHPIFGEGKLAIVHACGSGDKTRSHFEAMATMERGLASESTGTASGWIARHLTATEGSNRSPLRAVALAGIMPASLRGATTVTAINSLHDFRLLLPDALTPGTPGTTRPDEFKSLLKELYGTGKDEISQAGHETLAVLDTLNRIEPDRYQPLNGATYPTSELGNGLKQVACLIRGDVGLEVACLDRGGWDMHFGQNLNNWMPAELTDIGKCLEAFYRDLGPVMDRVTLVMMTEFGRRLEENKTLGTDHGRASVMFLIGGGVKGGKVYRQWPGLKKEQLEQEMDLKVTTDYRNVLAELLANRMHNPNAAAIFPGLQLTTPRIT